MELSELDLNNFSEWPVGAKAVVVALLCAAIGYAWYHFITAPQIEQLEQVEQREQELRQSFEQKQHRASNLEAYRQQLKEMEEAFGEMLRQLPDQTEVAALLVDVSQEGLAAGLEFERFEPSGEVTKDFYAELPINIRVNGGFHEFATFVSGLSALPRIVTVHNLDLGPGSPMQLGATVKTYRYLDSSSP
jgi:type IV pilus assembly protein PilO